MKKDSDTRGLLAVFAHHDALMQAIHHVQERQCVIDDVFSPVPCHDVVHAVSPKTSPVRFVTVVGAVSGLVGGLALAFGTSAVWNLIVGGKPVFSIVPFLVVAFEGTILLGALATFAALLFFCRLPHRRFPDHAYLESFSDDQFGLLISCPKDDMEKVSNLLVETGAHNVVQVDEQESRGGDA